MTNEPIDKIELKDIVGYLPYIKRLYNPKTKETVMAHNIFVILECILDKGYQLILKSELSEEEFKEVWLKISDVGTVNEIPKINGLKFIQGTTATAASLNQMSDVMQYLYSIHYAFNLDKNLYIEKK